MKRFLPIILAVLLCVLTLTGCNGKQKAEPQAAPGIYKEEAVPELILVALGTDAPFDNKTFQPANYSWNWPKGNGEYGGVEACGIGPADPMVAELRDPVLLTDALTVKLVWPNFQAHSVTVVSWDTAVFDLPADADAAQQDGFLRDAELTEADDFERTLVLEPNRVYDIYAYWQEVSGSSFGNAHYYVVTKGNAVGMANPWVEITEEEAHGYCPQLFKAPDGAEAQAWMVCGDLADPSTGVGPMIQLSFAQYGMNFTARAQKGVSEAADISGMYTEWTAVLEDVTLANWDNSGKMYRAINDTGYIDLITWFNPAAGVKYSLSVAAADLDGFDIQAVAEQMYAGEDQDQQAASGAFTGVQGTEFVVPDGFIQLDETPNIGYQYTFWHPDYEIRIVVYEIAPGYIPEGAYETDYNIASKNPDVTYFNHGENWFVQSGYNNNGEEIFYSKEGTTDRGLKTFWITYPTAKREFGDPIAAEFEKSCRF